MHIYTPLSSTPPCTANLVNAILFPPCLPSFLVTPAVSFQKKTISYSLLINPSSLFSISAETGEISLTRPIDYESDQHRYLLLVRASEGLDSMSSAAEVWIPRTVTFPQSNSIWHYKVVSSSLTQSVQNAANNIWQVFKLTSLLPAGWCRLLVFHAAQLSLICCISSYCHN